MSAKTATKKNTNEERKEFNLERALVMWIYKNKKGSGKHLSGKTETGVKLTGFFNKEKQNPKEPDIRIYAVGEDNKLSEEVYLSLWVNATGAGKKYLSGKLGDQRVVGFFNSKAQVDGVVPYINVYFSDDQQNEEAKPMKEATKPKKVATKPKKVEKEPEYEEIPNDDMDLPF